MEHVHIKLTTKQYEEFKVVCQSISYMASQDAFKNCVRSIYGNHIKASEIDSKLVRPLTTAVGKVYVKKQRAPKPETEVYFTKPFPVNEKFTKLHSSISRWYDKNLRYDPNENFCVSDVRSMLHFYLRAYSNVKDDTHYIEGPMKDLMPEIVDKKDIRKLVNEVLKKILEDF